MLSLGTIMNYSNLIITRSINFLQFSFVFKICVPYLMIQLFVG